MSQGVLFSTGKLPDLPDIMRAGLGLSDALGWWSNMMNTPGYPPEHWWDELKALEVDCLNMKLVELQLPTLQ